MIDKLMKLSLKDQNQHYSRVNTMKIMKAKSLVKSIRNKTEEVGKYRVISKLIMVQ